MDMYQKRKKEKILIRVKSWLKSELTGMWEVMKKYY